MNEITIRINGKEQLLPDGFTVEQLLTQLEVSRSHLAVELNRSIVPRTQFEATVLKQDDSVEIVSLVGGG